MTRAKPKLSRDERQIAAVALGGGLDDAVVDRLVTEIKDRGTDNIVHVAINPGRQDYEIKCAPIQFIYRTTSAPDPVGWVYFVRADQHVKIGFSKEAYGRMNSLQTGSPHKLSLLMAMEGPPSKEREFHRRFAHLQAHGEWFKMEGELLDFLDTYHTIQREMGKRRRRA